MPIPDDYDVVDAASEEKHRLSAYRTGGGIGRRHSSSLRRRGWLGPQMNAAKLRAPLGVSPLRGSRAPPTPPSAALRGARTR